MSTFQETLSLFGQEANYVLSEPDKLTGEISLIRIKRGRYETFEVPSGVSKIAPGCAMGCSIDTIVIPSTVKHISSTALQSISPSKIVFEDGPLPLWIENSALMLKNVTKLTVPDRLVQFGKQLMQSSEGQKQFIGGKNQEDFPTSLLKQYTDIDLRACESIKWIDIDSITKQYSVYSLLLSESLKALISSNDEYKAFFNNLATASNSTYPNERFNYSF